MSGRILTCARCGHPQDWHRLDDSLNIAPTDPDAPFRCIGYDCTRDGTRPRPCFVRCPDFVPWEADRWVRP